MKQKILNVDLTVNLDPRISFMQDIFQKKEIKNLTEELARIAGYLWDRRWAERNAGNISVNITSSFSKKELNKFSTYPFLPLPREYAGLNRKLLLITAAGSRMRDVARDPLQEICLVYISDSSKAYHIIVPEKAEKELMPTSELLAHLAIHEMLCQTNAPEKVLIHSHVTELIAITHNPRFHSAESLTGILWKMHPEALILQPRGYGFVPLAIPGTEKIATLTARCFEKNPVVIWEKQGALAIGRTISDAFDELDLAAKAASIYLICSRNGAEPEGLTDNEISEIKQHYGL
ncbi:MAG: rhamnulose-1-phosphate aldolase [Bacteroidetes bacterium]|nr:MAG: rhamnulose-1-phosphate aldolase [Bacteroidota bacterium]